MAMSYNPGFTFRIKEVERVGWQQDTDFLSACEVEVLGGGDVEVEGVGAYKDHLAAATKVRLDHVHSGRDVCAGPGGGAVYVYAAVLTAEAEGDRLPVARLSDDGRREGHAQAGQVELARVHVAR